MSTTRRAEASSTDAQGPMAEKGDDEQTHSGHAVCKAWAINVLISALFHCTRVTVVIRQGTENDRES